MSHFDLTILVIDENAVRAAVIEDGLREAGHSHVTVVHTVSGIARVIETTRPDVIIIDIENPSRDMMEHLFQLTRSVSRPIAMFVDRSDSASIEAAVGKATAAGTNCGSCRPEIRRIIDGTMLQAAEYSGCRAGRHEPLPGELNATSSPVAEFAPSHSPKSNPSQSLRMKADGLADDLGILKLNDPIF